MPSVKIQKKSSILRKPTVKVPFGHRPSDAKRPFPYNPSLITPLIHNPPLIHPPLIHPPLIHPPLIHPLIHPPLIHFLFNLCFFVLFLPYLQYCFCENPLGRLQLMLFLYLFVHLCALCFFVFVMYIYTRYYNGRKKKG